MRFAWWMSILFCLSFWAALGYGIFQIWGRGTLLTVGEWVLLVFMAMVFVGMAWGEVEAYRLERRRERENASD